MLRKISIQRFKSIRDADLEFGRVNMFIGTNGSGKSNFLEAIGLASACFSTGISSTELAKKGIRQSRPAMIKSAHKGMKIPQTLELVVGLEGEIEYKCNITAADGDENLRFHSESCKFQDESQFGRSGNGDRSKGQPLPRPAIKTRGLWDQIKASTDFDSYLLGEIDLFSRYRIFSPQTDCLRGGKSSNAFDGPIGLHGEGLAQAVLDIIRQYNGLESNDQELTTEQEKVIRKITALTLDLAFLPGWTKSFRVGRIDPQFVSDEANNASTEMLYFIDRFMNEKRNTMSAYDSSEGTLFLLFMAVIMCHREAPRIFGVDNIDSALNPFLTRTLIEAIIKISAEVEADSCSTGIKQVFMTSHNPTSVDAFDLFDDEQRVFVVYRDHKGQSKCDRLAPAKGTTREDWAERTGGKSLSQMWVTGQIPYINGLEGYSEAGVEL